MSQPCEKQCEVEQPGQLDSELDEFWVENPFQIFQEHNLSSFERNRAYINVEGKGFLEISHMTGADIDSDSRSVLAVDLFEPGKLDLVLRQVGGGPFQIFRNQFPTANYLKVSLRGVTSNSLGIGSRLVATVGERKIVRELFPTCSYRSQQPSWVHFGLGSNEKIDKLEIIWPAGTVQTFSDVDANRHLIITENSQKLDQYPAWDIKDKK